MHCSIHKARWQYVDIGFHLHPAMSIHSYICQLVIQSEFDTIYAYVTLVISPLSSCLTAYPPVELVLLQFEYPSLGTRVPTAH